MVVQKADFPLHLNSTQRVILLFHFEWSQIESQQATLIMEHFKVIKRAANYSFVKLQQKYYNANVTEVREQTLLLGLEAVLVRRVLIKTHDSTSLASVGWVVNENINHCLDCLQEFTRLARKHHCRACGNLVCSECSTRFAVLRGFSSLRQQRVCNQCNPDVRVRQLIF